MSDIVILGAGVCGLAAAVVLAEDGHEVMVLERDDETTPASGVEAWQGWKRSGVAQFRHPHLLLAGARHVLDSHLPAVREALTGAGGLRLDLLGWLPPPIAGSPPHPGDDRFITLTGRRPVVEYAFASVAEELADVRRGVRVAGLLTGPSAVPSVPHVSGVRTVDGECIDADLVIDATGRRSEAPRWLAALGARSPLDEAEDSGFVYYSRYFHGANGYPTRQTGLNMPVGSISLLTLPADNDTWSVTIYASSRDRAAREFRRADVWTNVVRACPLHAHWLHGDPISDVLAISGTMGRCRRFIVDGVPVATGVLAVGDASACTNPSIGRGVSLGLKHVARLRDVVRAELGNPGRLAEAWDAVTEAELTPWYRATLDVDRPRLAEMEALIEGRPLPTPEDEAASVRRAFLVAMAHDPDVFRAFIDTAAVLSLPQDVLTRPGLVDKIMTIAESQDPLEIPGPTRQELVDLTR
jgi:2-polyprenyl-6-methoxyphenol hydroxylase-like FAD-dependent oxidoreductase